jgi:hypothetical protein
MMCAFLRRLTTPWLADPRQPGNDADVNAAIYPANQRILEETENHGATVAVYFM